MAHSVYIASIDGNTGKSTVAIGVLDALTTAHGSVGVFRPVYKPTGTPDAVTSVLLEHPAIEQDYDSAIGVPYHRIHADAAAAHAEIISRFQALTASYDWIVVVGSDYDDASNPREFEFNAEVAANLGAPVVMVVRGSGRAPSEAATSAAVAVREYEDLHAQPFAVVANRVPAEQLASTRTALAEGLGGEYVTEALPESPLLSAPRVGDIIDAVDGRLLQGDPELLRRPALGFIVAAMSLPNVITRLVEGATVIAPGDRYDLLPGLFMCHSSDATPNLSSIVLTGGYEPPETIMKLISGAPTRLPLIVTGMSTYDTGYALSRVPARMAPDDPARIRAATELFHEHVDTGALLETLRKADTEVMTPLRFEFGLLDRARSNRKRVVLPEGDEPRILDAAHSLLRREVADLVLLGDEGTIRDRAAARGVDLSGATIISPSDPAYLDRYAEEFARLRASKGVTVEQARETMQDVSYFATMMVHLGEADGMVSGAAHTTAHTIRPSLQIIKTKPGTQIVSSVFLMAMQDRVLVYGDCAVNPDPNAEQLADIAASSAETAAQFGVDPRVAMLSYSTGASGSGEDVDKVRRGTDLVRERHPELDVEGPIQYDAAVAPSVAETKLPESSVAGRANVFIFPDLNSGNIGYKAVQRNAGAVAIGPVLQGLNKPVNDLSRGALVDDIINTVAITAIQAQATDSQG